MLGICFQLRNKFQDRCCRCLARVRSENQVISSRTVATSDASSQHAAKAGTAPSTVKAKPKAKKGKRKPVELPKSHIDIIRVLESRRSQLRNQIKLLREQEAVVSKSAKASAAKAAADFIDFRLSALDKLNIDPDHLHQDHLSNISDFRIQAKDKFIIQPPGFPVKKAELHVTKPKKKKSQIVENPSAAKSKTDEVKVAAKLELDNSLRIRNLKYLNSALKAYLNVCGRVDMVDAALNAITHYRERFPGDADRKLLLDVEIYNKLLNIYAKREKIQDVKKVFRWMKQDGVPPNARSFGYALETLSRLESFDLKTAKQIMQQMTKEGISCNDLFVNQSFIADEKEKVLEAVRHVNSNFQPVFPVPASTYQPPILQCLNEAPERQLTATPYEGVVPYEVALKYMKDQIDRETLGIVTVKSVDPLSEPGARTTKLKGKLEDVKAYWRKTLTDSFERNKEIVKNQHRPRGINMYPYLCALSTKEYVDIMLHEIVQLGQGSEGYSPSTLVLHLQTGRKAMDKYLINCKRDYGLIDRLKEVYAEYLKYFDDPNAVTNFNCRQFWQQKEYELKTSICSHLADHIWPKSVMLRVGKFLYDIIINDIKIDTTIMRSVENSQFAPAIYKVYRHYGDLLKEEVKPHPVLSKLFKASVSETLDFESLMCPSIVPPLPWLTTKTGGYLLRNTTFVRLPEGPGAGNVPSPIETAPSEQLYPVFDALNQLSASPWIINKPMLDLLIQVFRNKGLPEVDVPAPVSECPPLPRITKEQSPEERSIAFRERFLLKKKKNEMFSLWCDALYKLSIANHFRDSIFWFPHNIDFRGRVYPVPPHFHHLCGDMARSLLLFAKGMPLGERGLDWLKIHCINLTGLKKKASVAERLVYANEILDDILDSAENPLDGRGWWKKSDDPWQTLACCKEIATVMKCPDPASYVSHYPIHQDGSCNGLQHYAALGRDQKGAEQVNLVPFDKPQDVYNGVASLVEQQRAIDAANGVEIAKVLEGHVSRKVVKQTVMTIVYGVTRYGARGQIRGQLADIKELDQKKTWAGASYLAGKTFDSIKQMFTATRKIQDWFTDCARMISHIRERPVEWVTPVGLHVVQPYFKVKHGHDRSTMHTAVDQGKPNVMKQKNAFPPNFVHSLDSTHMMLTCLHSSRAGITFVSVHDCYWTHPATVHIMNKICREQFVAMHSQPILSDLSEYFVKNFAFDEKTLEGLPDDDPRAVMNKTLKAVPEKGSFKLESVLDSVYFFS